MKTKNMEKLLGKKVMPLVKMCYYDVGNDHNATGLCYLSKEDRQKTVRLLARQQKKALKEKYRRQSWIIWGIFADNTFELISDMGYSEKGVKRSDFRLIYK